MSTEYFHDEVEQTIDQFINEHLVWIIIGSCTIILLFVFCIYRCIKDAVDCLLCIPKSILKCIYYICSCRCFRCCFDYDPI